MRRLFALATSLLALAFFSCHRDSVESDSGPRVRAPAASAPTPATTSVEIAAPSKHARHHGDAGAPLPPREAYAGSEVCADCHEDEDTAFEHDWHARALARATPITVVGDFHDARFEGSSSEARMFEADGGAVMRTVGPDGGFGDFPVDYVIGGKRMQDSLTVFPDGRWQVLPVYFHVTGKGEWTDYTESKQGKLGPTHPFFWTNFRRTANHECLDCHVTGLKLSYDREQHAWSTSWADLGVACEDCHGPGARHAETQEKSDIVRPNRLDKARELAVCAQCHGPRNPLFPLIDQTHRFRPGDRYDDFYQALEWVDGRERSGDFFADGRPKSSSFEYQGLVQSRCFRQGQATCLSCHTAPHRGHGPAEVKLSVGGLHGPRALSPDEAACKSCHAAQFAQGSRHSHHRAKDASCLDCHMPKVLSSVLDHFADHAIDVPNPLTTSTHGVPNACGVCHQKVSPKRLEAQMVGFWPEVKKRQARRVRLADALDEATAKTSEPALKAVIADAHEAPLLRGAAAALLAQRFPSDSAGPLTPLLAAKEPLLRAKAADALGFTRERQTADALAAVLDDPNPFVRQSSALTLATFGDPRGKAALEKLATDARTEALPTPHLALGILASRRGDEDEARVQFERTVELEPYQVQALLDLADLAAKHGDLAGAREWLLELLRFDPAHRGARQRLELMAPRSP